VHHGEEQQIVFQGEKGRISFPWKIKTSKPKENGFPKPDMELKKKIQSYYDQLGELVYQDHTGQIDNLLSAFEGKNKVLIDGIEGRKSLELITVIYKASSTDKPVTLPLNKNDAFYTKQGILNNARRFFKKEKSVECFANNTIRVGGR